MSILDSINQPNDIKKIDRSELPLLAYEIRKYLVDTISKTGGHLASNLGCVELTMALHRVMDLPEDKIIWDVGHQSYVHKILTGRKNELLSIRQFGGISGFPKTEESPCDVFNTGHSSTAMSAALGMACARKITGGSEKIVAVVGDGSFTGGMIYEALNNMAGIKTNCLVVLNDNDMSIDHNVGGMSRYLNHIRVGQPYNALKGNVEKLLLNIPVAGEKLARGIKRSKDSLKQMLVPGMFFEELGVTYIGPIDGHNIELMEETFKNAFLLDRPILVHVKTVKGKGYKYAEKHPCYFHGIGTFDVNTGKAIESEKNISYTGVFARKLVQLGKEEKRLVAITAAMGKGTGVEKFTNAFPERSFDVGIAESHAVTFAAGLAASGMIPVVAVYSSFLQRAYDQILHDVCLQKLHVIFAVDRSGLVGADGETHQGIFDTAYMSHIPNLVIMAPKNRYELTRSMEWAVAYDGPVAIKYPRGNAYEGLSKYHEPMVLGKSELICEGKEVAIIGVGHMMESAYALWERFDSQKKTYTLVNARFIKPLDTDMIDMLVKGTGKEGDSLSEGHKLLVVLEEGIRQGGYGSLVEDYVLKHNLPVKVLVIAIEDTFVRHGSVKELRKLLGLDVDSCYEKINKFLNCGE